MKASRSLLNGFVAFATTLTTALVPTNKASAQQRPRPPQYIMISFDGSYTLEMWKATREHGLKNNARYTHFISGVDFLTGSSARKIPGSISHIYTPPRFNGKHRSNIGFGGDHKMMAGRIRQIVESVLSGMEIGGHANGHFDGTHWTEKEWVYEFDLFHDYVWNAISLNGIQNLVPEVDEHAWKALMETQHRGFRAPFLGRSPELYKAMGRDGWKIDNTWTKHRYTYDASNVSSQLSAWPTKRKEGIWDFPLVSIPVPGYKRPILSMDYNFYVAQSAGKENAAKASRYEEEMYHAYINWFTRNYHGNRAPINIGHHFSTWNKGAYWKALQRFVESVCHQPEVRCVTYSEMVEILENGLAQQIPQLQKGEFDQSRRPTVQIPLARLANAEVGYDQSQFIEHARYLKLDGAEWKAGEQILKDKKVDLVNLARKGVSHITRTDQNGSKSLFLDWDPHANTVSLKVMDEAEIHACDEKAHTENVNPAYLTPGVEI